MTNAVSANTDRSAADQPFLLSKTRAGCPQHNRAASATALSDTQADDPLREAFPAIQSGPAFIRAATERLKEIALFATLALRLDSVTGRPPDLAPAQMAACRLKAAQAVDEVAREDGAFWGLLSNGSFSCILPGRDQASGVAVARKIQTRLTALDGHALTVGIAAHPCLKFNPAAVIVNADKALAHAAFFGPGSRACFDAVTLNISGDCHYDAGDIQAAVTDYRNALRLDRRNVNVLNSLGVCFGVRQEFNKALTAFNAAARIDPHEVLAIYNAGLVHLLQGDKRMALKLWLPAASRGRDIFELNLQIGRLLLEIDQPDKAQGYIQQATALRPESAQVQRLRGDVLLAQGLTEKAIGPYKTALRTNPNDAAALSGLARCYELRNENIEIALSFCRQSVEIAPHSGRAHLRLGRLLVKSGRLKEALQAFQKAETLGEAARNLIVSVEERLVEKAS